MHLLSVHVALFCQNNCQCCQYNNCADVSCRDASASSSEGEEKKSAASASASGSMPEMSADSKQMLHVVVLFQCWKYQPTNYFTMLGSVFPCTKRN